jgi:hypothetical protein
MQVMDYLLKSVSLMVDFEELLGNVDIPRPTDPIEIFDKSDKAIGKEYLRPAQKAVLEDWYKNQ